MWGIRLIRRRIAVEGLRGGRSALKLPERGTVWDWGWPGWSGWDGIGKELWMDVYYSQDMTEASTGRMVAYFV